MRNWKRKGRHTEDNVRREHGIAYEDSETHGDGRIFCKCGWASPIAPEEERMAVLARHIEHEINAEEWCWGDPEKASRRYYEIEKGAMV